MEIKIQSIHFDATEKLQSFVEKKTAKLEKSFEDIQKVEVQLKVVKPATAMNKEASHTFILFIRKVYGFEYTNASSRNRGQDPYLSPNHKPMLSVSRPLCTFCLQIHVSSKW